MRASVLGWTLGGLTCTRGLPKSLDTHVGLAAQGSTYECLVMKWA